MGPPAARVNLAGKWSRTTVLASLWPLYAGEIRGMVMPWQGQASQGAIEGCYVVFLAATLLSSRSMALVTAGAVEPLLGFIGRANTMYFSSVTY